MPAHETSVEPVEEAFDPQSILEQNLAILTEEDEHDDCDLELNKATIADIVDSTKLRYDPSTADIDFVEGEQSTGPSLPPARTNQPQSGQIHAPPARPTRLPPQDSSSSSLLPFTFSSNRPAVTIHEYPPYSISSTSASPIPQTFFHCRNVTDLDFDGNQIRDFQQLQRALTEPVNLFFQARAPAYSFPNATASAQISRSNPPAHPESSVAGCSESVDTKSTSDQTRPHVVSALIGRSVPFSRLRAPLELVGTHSVRNQDPMLKTVSKFDKSEMVKLLDGRRGRAVADAVICAVLQFVPVTFSNSEKPNGTLQVGNVEIMIHGPSERENDLSIIYNEYPNVIVVDYTSCDAVNGNAELYCKLGVPFVMTTTAGDRELLHKTVRDANVYAVISSQLGKKVIVFLADMKLMAEQFLGAISGCSLQVMESYQAGKRDTSGVEM